MRTIAVALLSIVLTCLLPPTASAAGRVLKLEELSFTDIEKLDRAKTIFFLTFGNLEEHGPHLPVGSDYFLGIGVRDGMAEKLLTSHPEYDVVNVPVIPLGEGGANDAARQLDHVGTFGVRSNTLRSVAIDLGASIARKGFQNIFIVHAHGMPLHNVALTEASEFVSERYKVKMVNITSFIFGGDRDPRLVTNHLGEGWQKKTGFEGHAGALETSMNLFVRRDLVSPEYKRLAPFIAKELEEVWLTHKRIGWQGYWGDPALASSELGKDLINDFVERGAQVAEKALAGEDLSKLPSFPGILKPLAGRQIALKMVENSYAKQDAEVEAWLKKRRRK